MSCDERSPVDTPGFDAGAWIKEHNIQTQVPLGARKLGCGNCRIGDRLRHPEIGMVYCAGCPVTRRRMELGLSLDEATGDVKRERTDA